VDNYCPVSGANIIARGIGGNVAGKPVVASPLHKKQFSREDGRCLELAEHRLTAWAVRCNGGAVQVAARMDAPGIA
jgi:nitrite reductase (NADH) small subunit